MSGCVSFWKFEADLLNHLSVFVGKVLKKAIAEEVVHRFLSCRFLIVLQLKNVLFLGWDSVTMRLLSWSKVHRFLSST